MADNKDEYSKLSDEELMVLYQDNNYLAFESLYQRHSGRVYGYFQKKVNADISQELLQETFTRIHKSRDKYNPSFPFLPWVFTVARNILIDHFKKAETQTFLNSVQADLGELSGGSEISDLAGVQQLELALSMLPDQQQRALQLRYLEDWSFERIAVELKTSPQNVRQIVSRGLKKVKSVLGSKGD